MTTGTTSAFCNRVLGILGAADVSNAASAEDVALVTELAGYAFEDLAERGVCYVADIDNIPLGWINDLAIVVAAQAVDFGKPIGADAVTMAEARLRQKNAARYSGEVLPASDFYDPNESDADSEYR